MEKKKKKAKKWIHFRHRIVNGIASVILWPIFKIKTRFTYKRFRHKEPYLVLSNHQTVYDQFFLGYMLRPKMYFVATDDLTTMKFVSPLLNYFVHPIPYKKGSTDFTILRTCKKVADEGGTIVIFPEGNRTYSGETGYINDTIAKMIKFLKLPVAFVNITGGYGVQPRWANKPNRGKKMHCEVVNTMSFDEYKDLSYEEIFEIVKKNLYVDESTEDGPFKSKHQAEYLERAIYYCPKCGFSHFASKGNVLTCKNCGATVKYNSFKQFESADGVIPFKNVKEWYRYQEKTLLALDFNLYADEDEITSDVVSLFEVIPRKKKVQILEEAKLTLFKNRLEFTLKDERLVFEFNDIISAGVFGKNKMNFFMKDKTYQIKSDVHFNALKYVQIYYKTKIDKGEITDEFLGL